MIKLPVIASGLLWGLIMIFPDAATFSYVLFTICIAMGFIFLNEEPHNEYAYAQFHFQDGSTLCNIKTQNITYKIKWIIVKNEDLNKEYHFRIEDVKQVEYYNI